MRRRRLRAAKEVERKTYTNCVGDELSQSVGCHAGGFAAQIVAALVRNDDAKAGGHERLDLAAPAIPEFRKAVQKKDHRAVLGAGSNGMNPLTGVLKKLRWRFIGCFLIWGIFYGKEYARVREDSCTGLRLATLKVARAVHFDVIENCPQLIREARKTKHIPPNFCCTVKWVTQAFDNVTANVLGGPKKSFLKGHALSAHLA